MRLAWGASLLTALVVGAVLDGCSDDALAPGAAASGSPAPPTPTSSLDASIADAGADVDAGSFTDPDGFACSSPAA